MFIGLYISKPFLQKQAWPPNMQHLESTLIKILLSNKSSCIGGTVYKHPPMKRYSFNTSFSQLLQKQKSKKENKQTNKQTKIKTIITGDLNLNLQNNAKNFTNNFTPQINLQTRITGTSSILAISWLIIRKTCIPLQTYHLQPPTSIYDDHLP